MLSHRLVCREDVREGLAWALVHALLARALNRPDLACFSGLTSSLKEDGTMPAGSTQSSRILGTSESKSGGIDEFEQALSDGHALAMDAERFLGKNSLRRRVAPGTPQRAKFLDASFCSLPRRAKLIEASLRSLPRPVAFRLCVTLSRHAEFLDAPLLCYDALLSGHVVPPKFVAASYRSAGRPGLVAKMLARVLRVSAEPLEFLVRRFVSPRDVKKSVHRRFFSRPRNKVVWPRRQKYSLACFAPPPSRSNSSSDASCLPATQKGLSNGAFVPSRSLPWRI